ncbi:MAG: CDP-archaeol synthase [archaeon]|nr:CDP-archaeol synthase [archaeon]
MILFFGQIVIYLIVGAYSDWLYALTITIILIMPGYLANAGMVVVGGGKPLDRGHICKDGRRLFGNGKTIRGFFGGPLLFGVPIALGIHFILYLCWPVLDEQILIWFSTPDLYIIFDTPP